MRKKAIHRVFNMLLVGVDGVLVNVSVLASFWIKFGFHVPHRNVEAFLSIWPALTVLGLLILYMTGSYSEARKSFGHHLSLSLLAAGAMAVCLMSLNYLMHALAFPRSVSVISVFPLWVTFLGRRLLAQRLHESVFPKNRIAFIGRNGDANQVAEKALAFLSGHYDVAQIYDLKSEVTGELLEQLAQVDIVCLGESVQGHARQALIRFCLENDKNVYVIPDLYDILLQGAQSIKVDDTPVLMVEPLAIDPLQLALKRVIDIVLATAVLVLTSWMMITTAILVRLTSKGPVLYLQERVGKGNVRFNIIKFRTMISDAEKSTGPVLAKANDSRITPLGKLLRATRLDELPQLFNVLKGDMSLVGPRPERPVFVKKFIDSMPGYGYRLKVKPGITGLAQVEGRYTTDVSDKLRYDLMYIKNYSLLLDLHIILRTIYVVLMPGKAKGVEEKSSQFNPPGVFRRFRAGKVSAVRKA